MSARCIVPRIRSWRALMQTRRRMCSGSQEELQAFLESSANVTRCAHLSAFVQTLELHGMRRVDPMDRRHLHPLVIPVAVSPTSGSHTCMLRMPSASKGDMLPIVETTGQTGLRLVAPNTRSYLMRLAVEADESADEGKKSAVIEAANSAGELYKRGEKKEKSPSLSLTKYILSKVGAFPDLYEELALHHLERGDQTAALVAAERSAKIQHGWGSGYRFQALLYTKLGREKEAKDAAKLALMMPLWTLGEQVEEVSRQAGEADVKAFKQKIAEMSKSTRTIEMSQGHPLEKAKEEAMLERADDIMNEVCLGTYKGWDDVRSQLAEIYMGGGRMDLASFVQAHSER